LENKHKGNHPHKESGGKSTPPACRLVGYLIGKFCEYRANQKKQSPQEKSARVTSIATIWIALFTFVLAGASWYQGHINSGQLDEMKNQRLLTQIQIRANIRRELPQITAYGDGEKMIGVGETIRGWKVSPTWQNVGGTDATDFKAWFDIAPFDYIPGHALSAADCPQPTRSIPSAGGLTVHPGLPMSQLAKNLPIEDVTKAQNGTGYILMVGHMEYRDIFPESPLHHDDWCVGVVPNDIQRNIWSMPIIREKTD
jgi:hypothetical protein